ncbi:hypothetical protein D3C75_1309770 [compost metagenome]
MPAHEEAMSNESNEKRAALPFGRENEGETVAQDYLDLEGLSGELPLFGVS